MGHGQSLTGQSRATVTYILSETCFSGPSWLICPVHAPPMGILIFSTAVPLLRLADAKTNYQPFAEYRSNVPGRKIKSQ